MRFAFPGYVLLGFLLSTSAPLVLPAEDASPAALTEDQARTRIERLRAEIAHHDELYFKKAAPEISDAAYDALKRELAGLQAAFPGWPTRLYPWGTIAAGISPSSATR